MEKDVRKVEQIEKNQTKCWKKQWNKKLIEQNRIKVE